MAQLFCLLVWEEENAFGLDVVPSWSFRGTPLMRRHCLEPYACTNLLYFTQNFSLGGTADVLGSILVEPINHET